MRLFQLSRKGMSQNVAIVTAIIFAVAVLLFAVLWLAGGGELIFSILSIFNPANYGFG